MNGISWLEAGYQWGPPLVAVVLAVLLGVGVVRRWGWRAQEELPAADREARSLDRRRRELRARREALLAQLGELQADRERYPAEAWQREHDRLVGEAAGVLRELDALPAPSQVQRRNQPLPWGFLFVCLALVGAVLLVTAGLRSRFEAGLRQQHTADASGHATAASLAEEIPEDLPTLNAMTHAAILSGDLRTAMALVEVAREREPEHPEVRVHLAALQISVGMLDRAQEGLDAVVQSHPDLAKAHLWRGMVDAYRDRPEAAVERFERAARLAPDSAVARFARTMQAELSGGEAAPGSTAGGEGG